MTSWKEENFLTGFLLIAVIGHGMFFAREWLILGAVFLAGSIFFRWKEIPAYIVYSNRGAVQIWQNPAIIFVLMIIFSLIGLLQPVRSVEGWLEALRWLVYLTAFLWGKHLGKDGQAKEQILERILWVSFIATILTWLPGSEGIWPGADSPEEERFSSSFGYPNAAAAFFGCQLLLLYKDRKIRFLPLVVFALSLANTGSRAAVVLFIFFAVILILKKQISLPQKTELGNLGFYKSISWVNCTKPFVLIAMILLLQQTVFSWQGPLDHLFNWTDTSLPERMAYYSDSIKIAWYANFLPQAGGWLSFPFIQTIPYWTLDPHSSFFRIMLNQGLAGVIILGIWALRGMKGYVVDLMKSSDLTTLAGKTAALYLGLHSLVDVDMAFGALGILFWLLAGLNSASGPSEELTDGEPDAYHTIKD